MYTPAFKISRFRPLFLGLGASACGALCLASSACGGAAGKGDSPSVTPGGSNGAAGSSVAAGGTSPGGAVATAGTGGAAGGSGGGVSFGGATPVEGTATRPQLGATTAADYTVLKYLEKHGTVGAPVTDNWDPTAGVGDVAALTPKFTVAASGGTDTTVQSAITKAVAMGGTDRIAIEIAAGTYREVVLVIRGAPRFTL